MVVRRQAAGTQILKYNRHEKMSTQGTEHPSHIAIPSTPASSVQSRIPRCFPDCVICLLISCEASSRRAGNPSQTSTSQTARGALHTATGTMAEPMQTDAAAAGPSTSAPQRRKGDPLVERKDAPWVEKYRPKTLDDVAAHKEIIDTSERGSCLHPCRTLAVATSDEA